MTPRNRAMHGAIVTQARGGTPRIPCFTVSDKP
jgi:hypothetical protein